MRWIMLLPFLVVPLAFSVTIVPSNVPVLMRFAITIGFWAAVLWVMWVVILLAQDRTEPKK